jgi:hypothetical protein
MDKVGRFGKYGGQYVPETVMTAVHELEAAYDKYKETKEKFVKEENDSVDAEIRKYNAIAEKKIVEIEDEEFVGCELKSVAAKTTLDLGLAVFEKDVYVNFSSVCSNVTIILPEGVNVVCDVDRICSGVRNLVENSDEDGIHTVYIIGKAVATSLEVIPVDFYVDDDDVEDLDDDFDEDAIFANEDEPEIKVINKSVETESSDEDKEDKEETEEVNLEEVE